MRIGFAIVIFALSFYNTHAQYISGVTIPNMSVAVVNDTSDVSVKFANSIKAEDIKKHLLKLTSKEFEGRETGEPGNMLAAQYIAAELVKLNLETIGDDGCFQNVAFTISSWEDTDIFINGNRYRHLWDYLSFPSANRDMPVLTSKEVIFLGYGIDDTKYTDYKGKKFKDAILLINAGEPMINDSIYRISGTKATSNWTEARKLRLAKERGVKLVLIIQDNIKEMLGENRKYLLGPQVELGDKSKDSVIYPNVCYISSTIAKDIIGSKEKDIIKMRKSIMEKGKSKPVKLKADVIVNQKKKQKSILGKNVLGMMRGTDKKDEYVFVTAHYDHLGKRGDEIFYGADDNASGTSTVLELAEAFAVARNNYKRPRRNVVFMLVTGEEKGLLGSGYYSSNPIIPIKNTVVDINIDMVGRIDEKHKDDPNYLYVIGSDRLSTDLHKINEDMNQKYSQMTLDYTYNDEKDPNRYYFRSDHYNFAKVGIPAIFFFNGVHADYHQPTDTPDKIDFDLMEKRGKMIFHTAWELANREERIKVDGVIK